jgi:hypothetical protein
VWGDSLDLVQAASPGCLTSRGTDHQSAPRRPVGQQPGRDREQQDRQRLRGLEQAGLAGASAQHQDGHERRGSQAHLFGRLGCKVRPGQPIEGSRKTSRGGR